MASQAEKGPWLAEGDQKRRFVQGMFSDIAPTYDLLNSIMSLHFHRAWRRAAVLRLQLREGSAALDVCCGTGDFIVPLKAAVGPSGLVVGVDFALPMLVRARDKAEASLCLGDAAKLPVADSAFDAVTVGWGLRNVPSVETALAEIARVLKPGGRFANLDMTRPTGLAGKVSERTFHTLVPVLGRLFGKRQAYEYLPKSTSAFRSADELADSMRAAGFVDVGYRRRFFGNVCEHWGTRA